MTDLTDSTVAILLLLLLTLLVIGVGFAWLRGRRKKRDEAEGRREMLRALLKRQSQLPSPAAPPILSRRGSPAPPRPIPPPPPLPAPARRRQRDESEDLAERAHQDRAVAEAARSLVAALDHTVPSWRTETLGHADTGDEVNAAWDALVKALEGA